MKHQCLAIAVSLVLVAITTTACDDGGSTETLTIAVSPDTYSVQAGSSITVTVHVKRSKELAGTPVYLTVDDTGDGLTAQADEELATADDQTILITTTATAAQRLFTLNITATGTTLERAQTIYVTVTAPPKVDVSAQIVDAYGAPLGGLEATLWGTGAAPYTVTTGGDGKFSQAQVQPPYAIAVVGSYANYLFLSLSSATPVLSLEIEQPTFDAPVEVSGNFTNAPAGTRIVGHAEGAVTSCVFDRAATDMGYACQLADPAVSTEAITVRALAVTYDANGLPSAYPSYQEASATSTGDGTASANLTFAAAPLATRDVSIHAVDASGTALPVNLSLVDTHNYCPVLGSALNAGDVVVKVPNDSRIVVSAQAVSTGVSGSLVRLNYLLGSDVTTRAIALPSPAITLAPLDAAPVTNTTTFSVAARTNAVTHFFFSTPSVTLLVVATNGTSVTPSQLQTYGYALTSGAAYTWHAQQISGLGRLDDGVAVNATFARDNVALVVDAPRHFTAP